MLVIFGIAKLINIIMVPQNRVQQKHCIPFLHNLISKINRLLDTNLISGQIFIIISLCRLTLTCILGCTCMHSVVHFLLYQYITQQVCSPVISNCLNMKNAKNQKQTFKSNDFISIKPNMHSEVP